MATEGTYNKLMQHLKFKIGEIQPTLEEGEKEDIQLQYDQLCESIRKIEMERDVVTEAMLDEEKTLEEIQEWARLQKDKLQPSKELRKRLKEKLDQIAEEELQKKNEKELKYQKMISEEQSKRQIAQQKEQEEAILRQQKKEEEWYKRRMELEMEITNKKVMVEQSKPQAVKLQKYTITPFSGDYKDWLRFWNQFTVEVDASKISDISKLNYLLELVKGKPKDDILGLPHTVEGYKEAKRILEETYGKDVKVHKALIKELEGLPSISSIHKLREIHDFYNRLSRVVRTLVTMKKVETAQSCTYTLMDKLGPVREALTQKDDDWEAWGLEQLVENLRKYVERNPLQTNEDRFQKKGNSQSNREWRNQDKLMMVHPAQRQTRKPNSCVYCGLYNHKSNDCTKVLDVASRREILKKNKLCFNCTGYGHLASSCKSRGCNQCNGRHHTSVCDKKVTTLGSEKKEKNEVMGALCEGTTLHPTVVASINGEEVRIMLDSGAGSSYVCTDLLTKLKLKPIREERKTIEQMYGTVTKRVEIYKTEISSLAFEDFSIQVEFTNAEKEILTYLPNPKIGNLKRKYPRLRRLKFSDEFAKEERLPIHVILGAADYQRIKTTEPSILGRNPNKDPGAELTMLGWIITGKTIDSGSETEKHLFLKSSQDEFERMCSLETLGISETNGKYGGFHEDFKENLVRLPDGTYSTRLPWKIDSPPLHSNKQLTLARLRSTTKRLEKLGKIEEYHEIMEQQLEEGILEPVPEAPTGEVVHYIPHQAVIRNEAETTRLRIVYDCSAKENPQLPSLNDCLETGPSLQPLIFDIMLRNRMKKYCITGDIQKAFLQIKVDALDRDAQRLFWYDNLEEKQIVAYRFTRVIFGSGPSPYILGATLEKHISQFMDQFPLTAQELIENTYVDDVQAGGDTQEDLVRFKTEATMIMQEGGFKLHKWHSNVPELEMRTVTDETKGQSGGTTYAKASVGTKVHETKILGIPWNTEIDQFAIDFSKCWKEEQGFLTKRKMLSVVNRVFDLLGFVSPVMITGKILYSQVCLLKMKWDDEVPTEIQKGWQRWINSLKKKPCITIPRSVVLEKVETINLHGFADASKLAVAAAIYVQTINSGAVSNQNLLVSKSKIAPKDVSIPRLELVAAHILSRLMNHVRETLKDYKIGEFHNWVDSTTVLFWLEGQGTWAQFVRNRTKKIKEIDYINWHYVPTDQNPSDMGSRGVGPEKLSDTWFCGPNWLPNKEDWPDQPEIVATEDAIKELVPKRSEKQMMVKEQKVTISSLEPLLDRCTSYWKLLRVTAFILRFKAKCKGVKKEDEHLTTEEIQEAEKVWLKLAQQSSELRSEMELKLDNDGIMRCAGRIPDYDPIFIPREHKLAKVLIKHHHMKTLHGGVSLTMNSVREKFWIPKLRSLVKTIVHNCEKCKRYRVKPLTPPSNSALPDFRVKMTDPFAITGVDFAGPMLYKIAKGRFGKAYVALFTCASTRAVHLRLCHDLTAIEFQRALKEFVARRGCPQLMVSDNGKTFVSTGKWLSTLKKDENLMNYLAKSEIKWRFNLSRAPWWGGFFERLVGIMKRTLSKVIGNGLLSFAELGEVLVDTECCMNNRPLCYLGEEFEQPVLTPNTLLRGRPTPILEEDLERLNEDKSATNRLRHLIKTKESLRKRWIREYLHSLEKKTETASNKNKEFVPDVGSIVVLKSDTKDKAQWRLGRVVRQIRGKDGVIRGVKLKLGNGYLVERPLQLICDLEIACGETKQQLNPDAKDFTPKERPIRRAKQEARDQIKGIAVYEED